MTLVSIVTPTFPERENLVLKRCIESVFYQDYPGPVEHVVVSDRTDSWLMRPRHWVNWNASHYPRILHVVHINESWRNPVTEASIGAIPWYIGSLLAQGEFVGFLGDDDEFKADHITRSIQRIRESEADFSISPVEFCAGGTPQFVVGDETFQLGHLDSDGIMCRASCLRVANWSANGQDAAAADYRLVRDWLAAGLKGTLVPGGPTAVHHDGWLVGRSGRPDRP